MTPSFRYRESKQEESQEAGGEGEERLRRETGKRTP
jgi:hypothetical protein